MKKVSVLRLLILIGLYSIFANLAHPIEPTIYTNLGFHDYMFGVAMAAMSLTNFLFAPFWGKMMDRYGCSKLTGISFFGYSVAQYFFATSTTELSLTLARLLAGIFLSAITVCQMLYIVRTSTPEKASKNLMYGSATAAVMSPVGYLIGGVMGDFSIWVTMMTQVAGLAVIGLLFLFFLDDPKTETADLPKLRARDINPLRNFTEISPYLNRMVVLFFVISFATYFASICYEHSFNYLIKEEYGFSPSYNGVLKALVGIVALISNATICSFLFKHTKIQRSIIGVLAVCTVMSVGIVLIKQIVPFIAINVVFFGLNSIYLPMQQSILIRVAKEEEYGVFTGMFNAVRSVGSVGGSLVAGFAYELSSRLPFAVTAVLFGISVVCAVVNYRQLESKKYAGAGTSQYM